MAERSSYLQLPITAPLTGRKTLNPRRVIFPASEKWVHAIPAILFFCFVILWWFSHPVTVEIRNGRIMTIHHLNKSPVNPAARNKTLVEIAILASSSSSVSPAADSFSGKRDLALHNATKPTKANATQATRKKP